jgi:hypothetical protein
MEGQDERAGSSSVIARGLVVGDELDGMNDAAFVVEIDEVVWREPGDRGNASQWIKPEGRNRVGVSRKGKALDENLHGPEGLGLRIDDGHTGNEATGAGLVVNAVFGRRHSALVVTVEEGTPEMLIPAGKFAFSRQRAIAVGQ